MAAALAYLANRWSVVPVAGKRAVGRWKQRTRLLPAEEDVRRMFRTRRATGVAVICGTVSGSLRVRDFDDPAAYEAWAARHPNWAALLPTVVTPRGFHLYFRADLPDRVVNMGDGELRGGNGYVVAPPSRHPSGGVYRWHGDPPRDVPWVPDPATAGLGLPPGGGAARPRRLLPASSFPPTFTHPMA
jgi:hypothetical protein